MFGAIPGLIRLTARKKLKRKGEYWLIRSIAGLARALPRGLGHRVFGALGLAAGRMLSRDRRTAVDNLAIAFPEVPALLRAAMVRAMFKNLGRNAFDFVNLEGRGPEHFQRLVERVEGLEHFQRAYGEGRGVLGITGHIGCWELLPAYFAAHGYDISVVGRRMRAEGLDRRLAEMRRSFGVESIDRDGSPRHLVETLRRGRALGVLIDQHTSVAGIYVPFFGRPALTPTAVAKLALMTGSPIVPMAIFLGASGRHIVHVMPPLEVPAAGSRDEVIRALTERCSLAVEALIRIDPKQWVWFHRRWREGASYAVQA
jgi:KDO2-lipid IV(A) lauroyltransferase